MGATLGTEKSKKYLTALEPNANEVTSGGEKIILIDSPPDDATSNLVDCLDHDAVSFILPSDEMAAQLVTDFTVRDDVAGDSVPPGDEMGLSATAESDLNEIKKSNSEEITPTASFFRGIFSRKSSIRDPVDLCAIPITSSEKSTTLPLSATTGDAIVRDHVSTASAVVVAVETADTSVVQEPCHSAEDSSVTTNKIPKDISILTNGSSNTLKRNDQVKSAGSGAICCGSGKNVSQDVYIPKSGSGSDQEKDAATLNDVEIEEYEKKANRTEIKREDMDASVRNEKNVTEKEESEEEKSMTVSERQFQCSDSPTLDSANPPIATVTSLSGPVSSIIETDCPCMEGSNVSCEKDSLESAETTIEQPPVTSASKDEPLAAESELVIECNNTDLDPDSDDHGEVCANFEIDHHQLTRISYRAKTDWWSEEIENGNRCKVCWLRMYECFCGVLSARKIHYEETKAIKNVKVCMYYHYQELGRSANTAHLFQALCPSSNYETVVFGDTDAEIKLVQDIIKETIDDEPMTCVLYPSKDAILLSEWVKQRPAACMNKPIRLVALDGTYGQANRQWKYLTHALALLSSRVPCDIDLPSTHTSSVKDCYRPHHAPPDIPPSEIVQKEQTDGLENEKNNIKKSGKVMILPVVKLDLEFGKCDSVLAGIMHQPGKDKICTYQALVMAMAQAGEDAAVCASFSAELKLWISHILKRKIKFGKTKIRKTEEYSATPADFVLKFLAENPPPTGPKSKKELADEAKKNIEVQDLHNLWKNNGIVMKKTKRFGTLMSAH